MPIVLKSGSLNLLEPSGPVEACNGIALPFCVCMCVCIYLYILYILLIIEHNSDVSPENQHINYKIRNVFFFVSFRFLRVYLLTTLRLWRCFYLLLFPFLPSSSPLSPVPFFPRNYCSLSLVIRFRIVFFFLLSLLFMFCFYFFSFSFLF